MCVIMYLSNESKAVTNMFGSFMCTFCALILLLNGHRNLLDFISVTACNMM